MTPRAGIRVLASRGASGIDGTTSAAIGAALAHQAAGGGPAFALLGDLAFLHDAPGLILGPGEPAPDLCLIVVNNDGGRNLSLLEQAAFSGPAGPFERVFGTPHGADLGQLALAAGLPYTRLQRIHDLPAAMAGSGLRVVEARTDREVQARLCGPGCSKPPPQRPPPPPPQWPPRKPPARTLTRTASHSATCTWACGSRRPGHPPDAALTQGPAPGAAVPASGHGRAAAGQ